MGGLRVKSVSGSACRGWAHRLLLNPLSHEAFSDSYRVFVLGWDSVVVEDWSACFLVGLVLGLGQGGYFGKLALSPVGLPRDA